MHTALVRGLILALVAVLYLADGAHADPLQITPIYSSKSTGPQSYLRIVNLTDQPGTITLDVVDDKGAKLGAFTKVIAANTAPQIGMTEIEAALSTKPTATTVTIAVTANFAGQIQNAIYNPVGGALTNLSACGYGTASDSDNLTNVHTTLLKDTYPSSITIASTGAAGAAVLQVYEAASGTKLGDWTSPSVPAGGAITVLESQIEQDLQWTPAAGQFHLNVKLGTGFSGTLSHLVDNLISGVLTDMTARCRFSAS
jgi:hypothetical protein